MRIAFWLRDRFSLERVSFLPIPKRTQKLDSLQFWQLPFSHNNKRQAGTAASRLQVRYLLWEKESLFNISIDLKVNESTGEQVSKTSVFFHFWAWTVMICSFSSSGFFFFFLFFFHQIRQSQCNSFDTGAATFPFKRALCLPCVINPSLIPREFCQ